MADLTDFDLTDLVDDHVAGDVNILRSGLLKALYVNTETITATKELADSDCQMQVITPSGADRTVELPPEATTNHVHFIKCAVGASYDVVVKDDSGATTYCTLDAGEWALCIPAGSAWHVIYSADVNNINGILETASESVLGSTYSIVAAAGTYADTGLSITLPAAGTYSVTANVRAEMLGSTGTAWYMVGKFYNSTDAADVTNSERMLIRTNSTILLDSTAPMSVVITVSASKTIKFYAKRDGGGTPTFTTSNISSDASGRTTMMYRRLY